MARIDSIRHDDFTRHFCEVTGNPAPFPWQEEVFRRFAAGTVDRSLDIPTGLGKTAVMAVWLLARAVGASIPRRLVYVVDRRAVVDQASEVADVLREAVGKRPALGEALKLGGRPLPVSTLRGQHVDNKLWLEDPSAPALVVGTIDMIGSRLLFEGYGVSRKMRPYHAGLLGADTLIVLDEAHLVPPFELLLDAIVSNRAGTAPRDAEARAVVPPFRLMCLSATGRPRADRPLTVSDKDLAHPVVRQRLDAVKRLELKTLSADDGLTRIKIEERLAGSLAREAWRLAGDGTAPARVILFCDKRKVAEAAKKSLEQLAKAAGQTDIKERTELLVGGRRVYEREEAARRLRSLGFLAGSGRALGGPTFVFATSAGEVGIDLDADHMACDLVAWERMIQRLGRVNRRGEGDATVVVFATPDAKGEEPPLVEAKRSPFRHLPRYEDLSINASPAAIRELKARANSDEEIRAALHAATTPEPLRPALIRPLVDAWSMTSLVEHTGRPEIGPWLRGWVDDVPQTTVVWRTHLPVRGRDEVRRKEIEAFFESAPPHTSEALEAETDSVMSWLSGRAKALFGSRRDDAAGGWITDQPCGFVLSPAGDLRARLLINADGLELLHETKKRARGKHTSPAGDEADRQKDADKKALRNATLVVDARFAGLLNGLLAPAEKERPRTVDDGREWLSAPGSPPIVQFRVRLLNTETGDGHSEPGWRTRFCFPTSMSADTEPGGRLAIEKWRGDSATEEDRAVGPCQRLEDHQGLAEKRALALAGRLGLLKPYSTMLGVAARLHDEGKKASRWQRAFKAPQDGNYYAKTPGPVNVALLDGYRHEFRSVEVAAHDPEFLTLPAELQDLALHLIAAHHGFGRPLIGTGGCDDAPPSKLEARAREIALRFARLQQRWGPWGLAWWESLLRAADQQASCENEADETQRRARAVQ